MKREGEIRQQEGTERKGQEVNKNNLQNEQANKEKFSNWKDVQPVSVRTFNARVYGHRWSF